MGNHDFRDAAKKDRVALKKLVDSLEKCGENVHVPEDGIAEIELRGLGEKVALCGFKDRTCFDEKSAGEALDALRESGCDKKIMLMHNPDLLLDLEKAGNRLDFEALVLAGHTHGGQVKLPFRIETYVLRKDRLPRKGMTHGLYDYNNTVKLYITCGLGESALPVRLGTRPEVVFVYY